MLSGSRENGGEGSQYHYYLFDFRTLEGNCSG